VRTDAGKPAAVVPQPSDVVATAAALWQRLVGSLMSRMQPASKVLRRANV
jgi:hypothetical protein